MYLNKQVFQKVSAFNKKVLRSLISAALHRTFSFLGTYTPVIAVKLMLSGHKLTEIPTHQWTKISRMHQVKNSESGEGRKGPCPLQSCKIDIKMFMFVPPLIQFLDQPLGPHTHTYKICHTWTPCQLCPRVVSLTVL